MMRYQKLSFNDAKNIITEYDNYDDNEFQDLVRHWKANDVSSSSYDSSYEEFRNELLSVFNVTVEETKGLAANRAKYLIDLRMG